ncbi:DNA gyrase subunit A [Candidatus Pacearchaeota archaeon]|nr:DNA gyrase subunit A [Candidatus Pacearchaeota archaeon]
MTDKEKQKDKKEIGDNKSEHDGIKNGNSPVTIDHISKDETILDAKIEDEMQSAYINYAMSVIVARALPSVEDGLKPVQRRILHAMNEMGLASNKSTKKSARIVGEVLGKFHPHGDTAVYDAMVRMAQEFSLRYPLVTGQGNFGSIDGDPPAAMRYTEAKLSSLSEELLLDIDKKTVKMLPNFDNSLTEPETLPAKVPNLLINGCQGIAVGMMTSIPPHNLNEVCDATIAYLKNPEIDIEKLMEFVLGPDLPTYGAIQKDGLKDIYMTGRGGFMMRGKINTEEEKDREKIIITELPYQVNKAELIKKIAALVQEKRLDDISDIRDESAKDKMRIVIFLKRGANTKLIINKLYHLTNLQCKFNAIMLALVNGQPRILNLKQFIENYVKYRKEIIRKRTQFDLKNAQDHEHILEGLMICLKNLDDIIALIKKAKGTTEATEQLMAKFKLSQKQAQAILEMKLQKLTVLEQDKLKKDFEEVKKKIKELEELLASEQAILDIIKQDLQELKRKYGDDRRTRIIERVSQVNEIDLIKKEDVAVMMTSKGYIKRMPLSKYQEQHRGGKGVTGSDLTTGDFMQSVFVCSTHDYILFLTERGRMYLIKAYNIPEADRYAKGKPIVNILNVNEKIKSTIPLKEFKDQLFIVTEKGVAKSLDLTTFAKIRQSGIKVISLPNDDFVVKAKIINQKSEAIIATKEGTAIRFPVNEVRVMGNNAYGVTVINLEKEDKVIGVEVFDSALLEKAEKENQQDLTILTITERGFGKRTVVQDYRRTHRGGKGVTNMNCSDRNGKVSGIQVVTRDDGLIITTAKGMVIRVPITDIREMGRNTQGVRIIKISEQDSVTDVVKIQYVE